VNTTECRAVTVGIDAAVTANHHVIVRAPQVGGRGEVIDDFVVAPTLAGLEQLTDRLADHDVAVATAEPTSMTWLSLGIALERAGTELTLVGARHVARLRGGTCQARWDKFFENLVSHLPWAFGVVDGPVDPARW